MIAITPDEEKIVLGIIAEFAPDCEVYAYGSRVKGTHREWSDLDLAFVRSNGEHMPLEQWGSLKEAFGESDIVFRVDVTDYNGIEQRFRDIIDRGRVKIYSPNCAALKTASE
ncbi:MAG: nucleotidyltransferase domain-containing protein [Chitinispirillales bacterium]|jgi:predicted nucleotidyltransferase|nr:nucleotidyltransferase domain-containing protein [Chitinispirillales bacterium]